jgi:programmed cell death 6-interacting protein
MLAQAQEMVAMKAIQDKMKDPIIAKLCSQCEDMYASVMRSMQRESLRNIWESSWLPNVSGKQAIYHGLAQYHQSKVCNASKTIGEEIARLVQYIFNFNH